MHECFFPISAFVAAYLLHMKKNEYLKCLKEFLSKIAEDEDGCYEKRSEKFQDILGARYPITTHWLEIIHKGVPIHLIYELGSSDLAEIEVEIEEVNFFSDFKISTKDHFTRLFSFSKSCLLYTSPSPRDATLSRMPSSA